MKSTKVFFQNKKILIYGFGKTGKSAFNFLKKKNNLKVFDDNLPLTNLPYNKKFIRKSEYKIISEKTSHSCYETGLHTASCCSNHENLKSNKVFHLKSSL